MLEMSDRVATITSRNYTHELSGDRAHRAVFVSGHDFSRAESYGSERWALGPEGFVSSSYGSIGLNLD